MTRTRFIVGAVFAGVAVLTVALLVTGVPAEGTAQVTGYQQTGDPRRIVVIVGVGLADQIADRKVDEDERSVRVTVRKVTSPGSYPAILIFLPVTVSLQSPLGNRTVLDQSGATVHDLGTYEPPGRPTASP